VTFDLLIHPLVGVGGEQPALVLPVKGETGESLGKIFLYSGWQILGRGGRVGGHELFEACLGVELVGVIENLLAEVMMRRLSLLLIYLWDSIFFNSAKAQMYSSNSLHPVILHF